MPRPGPRPRERISPVSHRIFLWGDGTRSYFPTDAVHANQDAALEHWRQAGVRRLVWGECWRFKVPRAAECFDNISNTAQSILWSAWGYKPKTYCFPLPEILAALAGDVQAVADFRREDREGAQQIDDFLDLFLADLGIVESEARRVESEVRPVGTGGQVVCRPRPEIAGHGYYDGRPGVPGRVSG